MSRDEILKKIKELEEKKKDMKVERCEVYSRVVGYLRPVQQWNDGKQEEFSQRKSFKVV
ncbi:anaerobic ribonucleoside-triphosphate reductase [Hippea maritima]|uniref:anaerobic ribonucleoside-triphosphate reductase n=1 Tax=Hippea maritima TaxID=84405 RepID=UPI00030C877B|nr:anaerobic ribonucleoside-triphosphate reductase [Hippea maritima]